MSDPNSCSPSPRPRGVAVTALAAAAFAFAFGAAVAATPHPVHAATAQAATTGDAPAGSTARPGSVTPAPAAAETPQAEVVERLQAGLIGILESGESVRTEKGIAALGGLVGRTFDIDRMGAIAVGRQTFANWSPFQRKTFLDAFTRFMIATHATRFENAPAQGFTVKGQREAQGGRVVVEALYTRAGEAPVAVDYLTHETPEGWRILDVYIDGQVSLLALHRSEFASVLREKGYDGFIAAMNAKSKELESRAVN